MTICAIHQPNFFPWLGYFNKIELSDYFIILDDVAYPKSGSGSGSWSNRVKLGLNGEAKWAGCPVKRESGVQLIKAVEIDDSQPWRKKLIKSIQYNYSKSTNYKNIMPIVTDLINYPTTNLCDFNVHTIKSISTLLGLECTFKLQSELNVPGASTQLLINLTKKVEATTYLCGGGAGEYQDDKLIANSGLELSYQNFKITPYCEESSFIPCLSIIDYLMKCPSYNRGTTFFQEQRKIYESY